MLVWQGALTSVEWPGGHEDLHVELWGDVPKQERLTKIFSGLSQLHFSRLAPTIPLYAVTGPELAVYTSSEASAEFFGLLAAAGWILTVTLSPPKGSQAKLSVDHLAFYAVDDDDVTRICARPIGLPSPIISPSPAPQQRQLTLSQPSPEASTTSSGFNSSSATEPHGINGPVRALQQTVLGALRLRGIMRDHPNYKQLYHLCFRCAEYALRNHKHPIPVDLMREKVEATLTVLNS